MMTPRALTVWVLLGLAAAPLPASTQVLRGWVEFACEAQQIDIRPYCDVPQETPLLQWTWVVKAPVAVGGFDGAWLARVEGAAHAVAGKPAPVFVFCPSEDASEGSADEPREPQRPIEGDLCKAIRGNSHDDATVVLVSDGPACLDPKAPRPVAGPGGVARARLKVTIRPAPPPVVRIGQVEVRLATRTCDTTVPRVEWKSTVGSLGPLGLPPEDEQQLAACELVVDHAGDEGLEGLKAAARETVRESAVLGLVPSRQIDNTKPEDLIKRIRDRLWAVFSPQIELAAARSSSEKWPMPVPELLHDPLHPSLWTLRVLNLAPARHVTVVAITKRQEAFLLKPLGARLPEQDFGPTPAWVRKIQAWLAGSAPQDVTVLTLRAGMVPTASLLDADKTKLSTSRRVGTVQVEADGDTIVYGLYPDVEQLDVRVLTLDVDAGYDPEDGATLGVGLDAVRPLGIGGRLTARGSIGPDATEAEATYRLGWDLLRRSADPKVRLRSGSLRHDGFLAWAYRSDPRTLLADPQGLRRSEERQGLQTSTSLFYDSFSADAHQARRSRAAGRPRDRWYVYSRLGFGVEDDELGSTPNLAASTGQAAGLVLEIAPGLSLDLSNARSRGVSQVDLQGRAAVENGVRCFGGGFVYQRFEGELGLVASYEAGRRLGFEVGFTRGFVSTYGAVPAFKLARLGGPNTLRGLEEGELAGRAMVYSQLDVGLPLGRLWGIRPAGGGIDLSTLHLLWFLDSGRTATGVALADVLAPFSGNVGTGVALRLGGLPTEGSTGALELGYAIASGARHDRNGLFYVGYRLRR